MLLTCHWSATQPVRLRDYHVEFALTSPLEDLFAERIGSAIALTGADWDRLRGHFDVWKNDALTQPTDYGTWHLNHDPRDDSANIEIGALCMANATTQRWGRFPFTRAHAWMMAGIVARICTLKSIDIGASFGTEVAPSVLQNGPIFNVSTHAERALQTQNPGVPHPELGYFAYSGDPDLRWDLAALDPVDAGRLGNPTSARAAAIESAAWIRAQAHAIKVAGVGARDMWGLDAAV